MPDRKETDQETDQAPDRLTPAEPSPGPALTHLDLGGVPAWTIEAPPLVLPEALTASEREVTELLMSGATNAEIAEARGSKTRTVANQVAAIFRKLGVNSRAELLATLLARR